MKNTNQRNSFSFVGYGIIDNKKTQAKIIDFVPDQNHHFILKLKISNINDDNYKLVFNNNQLTVILFESIEFNKPVYIHNYRLNDLAENPSYDELKSIDFILPDDDYYLIGHKVMPHKGILEVIFGKINYN
jgi:hypothetical protein